MRSRTRVYLGAALVLAAVATGGFFLSQLAAGQQDGSDTDGQLSSASSPGLSVCVDGAAGYSADAAELEAVQAALQAGLDAAPEAPAEFSEPLVTAGCPAPPAALTDSTIEAENRFWFLGSRVDTPSKHGLFVYFMPPEVYTASFGGEPVTKGVAEVRCSGDICLVVTRSVYAPQTIAAETLQRALMEVLGVIPPPTPVPCDPEDPDGPMCDVIEDDIADIAPEQGSD